MDNTLDLLKKCNNDTPLFSLNGKILNGKIVDVYDADTCKIVFFIDNQFVKFNCRLSGIDTPEMRPKKNNPDYSKEKKLAIMARNRLIQLCSNDNCCDLNCLLSKKNKRTIFDNNFKLVKVKCGKFDKYGRLLVEIFNENISFNDVLINENYALKYDGGTKTKNFNYNLFFT